MKSAKIKISKTRKTYFIRLFGRCIIFFLCLLLYLYDNSHFQVLIGWNFFREFSLLHVLWLIWMLDMLYQLIPAKGYISLGSQKHFLKRFRPISEKINYEVIKDHVFATTKAAYKVFLLWGTVVAAIGILSWRGILNITQIFMIVTLFYVCDLICVLIWCPFRLIMKNRCCTTCRIFNWDHLMMFSPFILIPSFYTTSLLLVAISVWIVWELCVMLYPERFWENSNEALKCTNCTDKLCTQYCRKLNNSKKE